ncbi:MAG TPA: hypothetical protein VNE00_17640 [Paraburkholderia sp.]|nr:hypothetical protein [Paraburkholderia sp.]
MDPAPFAQHPRPMRAARPIEPMKLVCATRPVRRVVGDSYA